jgi:hypothetical protein
MRRQSDDPCDVVATIIAVRQHGSFGSLATFSDFPVKGESGRLVAQAKS